MKKSGTQTREMLSKRPGGWRRYPTSKPASSKKVGERKGVAWRKAVKKLSQAERPDTCGNARGREPQEKKKVTLINGNQNSARSTRESRGGGQAKREENGPRAQLEMSSVHSRKPKKGVRKGSENRWEEEKCWEKRGRPRWNTLTSRGSQIG